MNARDPLAGKGDQTRVLVARAMEGDAEAVKKIYHRSMKKLIDLLPAAWREEGEVPG